MWTKQEINNHKEAATRLLEIKDLVFEYLRRHPRASELETHRFILRQYEKFGLKTDLDLAIVAFGKNTANVHYYPGKDSRRLKDETLVMIDLWARLDRPRAPFADITWMAYRGQRIPGSVRKVFQAVKEARDHSLRYAARELKKKRMPAGARLDKIARGLIARAGFDKKFLHSAGHRLGFNSPHGDGGGLTRLDKFALEKNVGYTLEPGIYLQGRFGVRSEIDFYIGIKNKLVVTTEIQQEIERL